MCSRVTFVNFTITRGSLEMQCLNQVLRSERPDIDQKRNDLLKLQGEFAARLRHLEKALLNALNDSKGKILDDDSVITTLERLKNEAKEVAEKSAETDHVMKEVRNGSLYKFINSNLGRACVSKICSIGPSLFPYLFDDASPRRSLLPIQLLSRILVGNFHNSIKCAAAFWHKGE